jgi:predicted Abi (CAAX) family protease
MSYLRNNYLQGLRTSPFQNIKVSIFITLLYALCAFLILVKFPLFHFQFVQSNRLYFIPFILFIFPSFLEESFFRGILIPNNFVAAGFWKIAGYCVVSTLLFVLWHPFNALTINPSAKGIFMDPHFLLIVFFLGIACSVTYVYSRSLWVPITIHWLTVVIWVIFLGGRNLAIMPQG